METVTQVGKQILYTIATKKNNEPKHDISSISGKEMASNDKGTFYVCVGPAFGLWATIGFIKASPSPQ